MARPKKIVRRALRLEQNRSHPLYLFTLTSEELESIADVSRVSRSGGKLLGYQRPAVKRHIQDITDYLNGNDVIFPNPIIVALPSTTAFRALRESNRDDGLTTVGTLQIDRPGNREEKVGWIVDGQQRMLALLASKRRDMPVPVNAFIADSLEIQRDQFLRVNSSRPLPRGLITELLPEIETPLPEKLASRRIPSALCNLLNQSPSSPFQGLIRRSSTPRNARGQAVVADSSVVKMLEASIGEPSGCLFPYRNIATGETDFVAVQQLLFSYWTAVRESFPEAWGRPPRESRLMHGAGIRAMGRLMDRVMSHVDPRDPNATRYAKRELKLVIPTCRWTKGCWEDLGNLAWNEVQNVPRHINMLSNYLVRQYLQQ